MKQAIEYRLSKYLNLADNVGNTAIFIFKIFVYPPIE